MSGDLLVLNSGSSSLKFALYEIDPDSPDRDPVRHFHGQITGLDATPRFKVEDASGDVVEDRHPGDEGETFGHEQALDFLLEWLDEALEGRRLLAAGHRVVHGGQHFIGPVRVTSEILERMEALVPLAPLHQPHNLAPIRSLSESRPELLQFACFDTAFHHTQSRIERRLALPRHLADEGVMRYGFHGLSYEFIAGALARCLDRDDTGRAVIAHLGSGASLAALQDGESVATTMGFTALDGLPMSTRCGALDPGAVLFLLQEKGMSAEEVGTLLYEESGLLGVSGISGDMRTLLESDEPSAAEAVDVFVHRTVREIGALTGMLGGLDHLVFTGGIGEHAPPVRARICEALGWLGVAIDAQANEDHRERISEAGSRVGVWVIPTDEERMIARHGLDLLREAGSSS
ncbi:MAG: acetate/propionate family kinase [Thioalkalivibrio sp.]|nr:MAG: acetate/propionate family kinase [Thioalkalivibrio sp.]